MKHDWTDGELTVHWSLTAEEMALLPNCVDSNRLGFAVQLKFFDIEGRFPRTPREIPTSALCCVADQLGLSPSVFQQYAWRGRARKQHRAAIRTFVDFRLFTAADASTLDSWLRQAILPSEQNVQHLQEVVLDWCREHRIEPPAPQRIERLIRSALHSYERVFFDAITQRLPPSTRARFDSLLDPVEREPSSAETSEDPAIIATVFSCSGLQSYSLRLANSDTFRPTIIANKKASGLMLIANGPTIDCERLANSRYGLTLIANSSSQAPDIQEKGHWILN